MSQVSQASQLSIDAPIASFRGAGPITAARLAARGIVTARDLLMRLPRGYDDLGRVTPLAALGEVADGSVVLVRGTVRRLHVFPRRLLDVIVEDEEGASVRARWFRAHASMAKSFVKGAGVALAGPVRAGSDGAREMVHPSNVTAALAAAAGDGLGLRPRYADIEGVNAADAGGPPGVGAGGARARHGGAAAGGGARAAGAAGAGRVASDACTRPRNAAEAGGDALARARRRIALETLFVTQVAFLRRRAEAGDAALSVPPDAAAARARLEAALGFTLTASQRRALDDIAADVAGRAPMQRLLVGDVGSGKTAVALGAAALVAAAGGQTLMMVPTEVLAEQQARALEPAAARLGLAIAAADRRHARARRGRRCSSARPRGASRCSSGRRRCWTRRRRLPRLGLAIVDEQHRFGVTVRAALARGAGRRRAAPAVHVRDADPAQPGAGAARRSGLLRS